MPGIFDRLYPLWEVLPFPTLQTRNLRLTGEMFPVNPPSPWNSPLSSDLDIHFELGHPKLPELN